MTNATHWTERSPEDFLYSIASDFVEQLQSKMATLNNMTRAKLAKAAGISKGRISQIFNDPGNISLDTIVRLARALGLKVSVVAYEDPDDPHNERGPVNADVLRRCWEDKGRPFDMWSFRESTPVAPSPAECFFMETKGRHSGAWARGKPIQSIGSVSVMGGSEKLEWEILSGQLENQALLRKLISGLGVPSGEAKTDAYTSVPAAT